MAYELVETIEVGAGGASSIEFTSIPQDGTDLMLSYSARNTGNTRYVYITFNNDTALNYTNLQLYGTGSGVGTQNLIRAFLIPFTVSQGDYTANTFGNAELYISNYTSNSAKSMSHSGVNENNSSTAYQYISADLWDNTAAVSSIKVETGNTALAEHSTFSLYKITAA